MRSGPRSRRARIRRRHEYRLAPHDYNRVLAWIRQYGGSTDDGSVPPRSEPTLSQRYTSHKWSGTRIRHSRIVKVLTIRLLEAVGLSSAHCLYSCCCVDEFSLICENDRPFVRSTSVVRAPSPGSANRRKAIPPVPTHSTSQPCAAAAAPLGLKSDEIPHVCSVVEPQRQAGFIRLRPLRLIRAGPTLVKPE